MSQELKRQIEEIVGITKNPTMEGVEKVIRLSKDTNSRISVVAVAAHFAMLEHRTIDLEQFLLLLELNDLN